MIPFNLAQRASVGSTDASGKSFRGSMPSVRLSPSARERLPPSLASAIAIAGDPRGMGPERRPSRSGSRSISRRGVRRKSRVMAGRVHRLDREGVMIRPARVGSASTSRACGGRRSSTAWKPGVVSGARTGANTSAGSPIPSEPPGRRLRAQESDEPMADSARGGRGRSVEPERPFGSYRSWPYIPSVCPLQALAYASARDILSIQSNRRVTFPLPETS
jgi:hypothetical protein